MEKRNNTIYSLNWKGGIFMNKKKTFGKSPNQKVNAESTEKTPSGKKTMSGKDLRVGKGK